MAKSGKFNLADILGSVPSEAPAVKRGADVILLHNSRLKDNEANFYQLSDLEELAEDIKRHGILEPVLVKADEGADTYTIIAGHRRTAAGRRADPEMEIPCIVVEPKDALAEELMLITTNSTARRLTPFEIGKQAKRLTELLQGLRKEGVELPGKTREIVADQLGVSQSKLARIQAIENNLAVPGFKRDFESGDIAEDTAYAISQMDQAAQYRFLDYVVDARQGPATSVLLRQFKAEDSKLPEDLQKAILQEWPKGWRMDLYKLALYANRPSEIVGDVRATMKWHFNCGHGGPWSKLPNGTMNWDIRADGVHMSVTSRKYSNDAARRQDAFLTWTNVTALLIPMAKTGKLLSQEELRELSTRNRETFSAALKEVEEKTQSSIDLKWKCTGEGDYPQKGDFCLINQPGDICPFGYALYTKDMLWEEWAWDSDGYFGTNWSPSLEKPIYWMLAPTPVDMDEGLYLELMGG